MRTASPKSDSPAPTYKSLDALPLCAFRGLLLQNLLGPPPPVVP